MMPPDWISKLGKLNPNVRKTKGAGNARFAPHKALLLLCMIDLAEAGELPEPELGKTPELRLRFDSYWRIVQARWGGRPGLDLPFHHLGNQRFWTPLTLDERTSTSPDTTARLQFDPEFLACLNDREFRREARFVLIRTWFPDNEQQALLTALGISKADAKREEFKMRKDSSEYQTKGRDARFRIIVVTQYRFTCALTGYGCHTNKGATIVEAAHIHSFSKSRNDSPDNGLALSRDAHWMFDEGLWSVDEGNRVLVSEEIFTEWGPEAQWLKARRGKPVFYLDGVSLRPAREHLAWHRGTVFSG